MLGTWSFFCTGRFQRRCHSWSFATQDCNHQTALQSRQRSMPNHCGNFDFAGESRSSHEAETSSLLWFGRQCWRSGEEGHQTCPFAPMSWDTWKFPQVQEWGGEDVLGDGNEAFISVFGREALLWVEPQGGWKLDWLYRDCRCYQGDSYGVPKEAGRLFGTRDITCGRLLDKFLAWSSRKARWVQVSVGCSRRHHRQDSCETIELCYWHVGQGPFGWLDFMLSCRKYKL